MSAAPYSVLQNAVARISLVWGEPCQARLANPTGFAPLGSESALGDAMLDDQERERPVAEHEIDLAVGD